MIGAMFIIREAGRRSRLAAVAGVGIGLGWALLHRGYQPPPVLIAMSVSGLLGGLLMAGFLTWVRRRWTWWTRWEINN